MPTVKRRVIRDSMVIAAMETYLGKTPFFELGDPRGDRELLASRLTIAVDDALKELGWPDG